MGCVNNAPLAWCVFVVCVCVCSVDGGGGGGGGEEHEHICVCMDLYISFQHLLWKSKERAM